MAQAPADAAVNSARAHHLALPGERRTAELIRELADEPVAGKARPKALEDEIEQLVTAHPDGALSAACRESRWSPRVGRPSFSQKRVGRNLCPRARKR
ncbi:MULTISPECIES: hypothetical protein [unclassified Streptomyces]|uniref:hypothetical protein n=1 Tax=unclassified Streptomyces TaxID=2593676 RepID=UPI00225771B7|nr:MULTISPECIES: hypothetical protein [unclassified Streptomyces]MCX4791164.1 hypothetical protein [Streptomyces sp. NBC_01221]WSP61008.1 hypothetical protein OG466_03195 [Streptomyces sp. NBC_01240]